MCPDFSRGDSPDDEDDRPYGTKPYGTKPYGTKPYGTKPYGTKPYGTKPYGTKPYGTKPYGTKPYGTKPYGTKEDAPDWLDPDEWSEDVAELFCSCSALIQLGARVVFDEREVPIPAIEPVVGTPQYLTKPRATDPEQDESPVIKESEEKPVAGLSERDLRPNLHELAVKAVVPNELCRDLLEYDELAWALKQDLARSLAFRADQAFLHGSGGNEPVGIDNTLAVPGLPAMAPAPGVPAPDAIADARQLVRAVRLQGPLAQWGCAGWVLDPLTLDVLTNVPTIQGLISGVGPPPPAGMPGLAFTLDTVGLLKFDGDDCGELLGFPYMVTGAATDPAGAPRMYFSSDWSEAWIGVDRSLVTVDISVEGHFQTDETVIRAVMRHDFAVRRPLYFAYVISQ